ncbi:DUF3365 domain-containing protein [Sulfurimonas sp.]|uniref:ATP-binding protein n=1 Tax=Sulfurimonas sp. TaxID=2022749 RepID=UPI002621BDF7|nr:DUF3365 domain-containing protein [Sulfurimonas sp.]MCW8895376.1 DUF3365 domain-containing protein [Sulfurimonas sp.]
MLNHLLNRLKLILIVPFFVGSTIFYFVLEDYHETETFDFIQDNVAMFEAMQEYVGKYQKTTIKSLVEDGKLSKDYFDPTLMSSTFIISKINEIFHDKHKKNSAHIHEKLNFKFPSDNPTNPANKADAFESEILKKFNNSDITSYSQKIERNGKKLLFVALPVMKNTKACMQCHGDPKDAPKEMIEMYGDKNGFNEEIGQIRAINAVYSTIDSDDKMWNFFLMVEFMMLIIFFIIYLVVRYFLVQLTEKDKFIAKQSKFAAMGEMIGMIAHQWRQPLTGMSITTNNLLLDIELQDIDDKRLKDNLEVVNKQISYLSETIDDFKNFFRPDNKPERVNIAQVVKDSCMLIDSSIKSNAIEIKLSISDDLTILTQRNDVVQIILNLIKNSIDAYIENKIEDNKIIEITAVDNPKRIELFIKDYAGGIPKDTIEKIFDPYFSTKDNKNGTGLGLYMSKMIVEDHLCGYLDVQSKDASTTFKIVLIKKDVIDGY